MVAQRKREGYPAVMVEFILIALIGYAMVASRRKGTNHR
jgi:hypothetical protein